MKFKHIFALVACATAVCGCSKHLEYDISEGFDKEITLFEDEISIPLGNAGPIAVHSLLEKGLAQLFGSSADEFITIDSDGYLWLESEANLLSQNVYELDNEIGDKNSPFIWNPGFAFASPGGIAPLLSLVGMNCVNQKVTFYAQNPLESDISVNTTAEISLRNASYETTGTQTVPIADFAIESGSNATPLAMFDLPATSTDMVGSMSLNDLQVSLPAHITRKISSTSQILFRFFAKYRSNVTVGDKLELNNLSIPIRNLNVPLSDYRLHKCTVSFDVESTLPLDVTFVKVEVLEEGDEADEPAVNENIAVSSNVNILGGSPDKPSISNIVLEVESLDGPLPDIRAIQLTLSIKAAEGYANTILNANQGISIKHATARISGGITIPLK